MKIASESLRRFVPLFAMAVFAVLSQSAIAENASMPDGPWRETCQDATIRGGMLYARCRQDDGQYRSTSALLLSTCSAYSNRNGQLYCERNGNTAANSRWGGSFSDSCSDISVDKHGRLSATCRRANGKSNRSNITPQQCPSYRAGNSNGKLVCESQGNVASRWEGSFQKSCRDISMNSSGTLTATCQNSSGNWQRTSLSPGNCNSYRAGNNNGQLVCESQGNVASRWDGSFQKSCRDVSMNSSGTLTATCQNSSGNWQRTSLSPGNCNSYRAGNNNGQLVCESQGNVSQPLGRVVPEVVPRHFHELVRNTDGHVPEIERQLAANQPLAGQLQQLSRRQQQRAAGLRIAGQRQQPLGGVVPEILREISMDSSGSLTATCQTMKGDWQRTSLGARQCSSARAGNNNGQLVCEN